MKRSELKQLIKEEILKEKFDVSEEGGYVKMENDINDFIKKSSAILNKKIISEAKKLFNDPYKALSYISDDIQKGKYDINLKIDIE